MIKSTASLTSTLRLSGVLSFWVCTTVLTAQDLWYRSYQDGVRAFRNGDYRTAEQKLVAAMTNRSAPSGRGLGRAVLYYGQMRDEFLPEYYLAVIYAKQGRWPEAKRFASQAEPFLKATDREYATLVEAKTSAEKALNPPPAAVTAGNDVRPPPPATPPAATPGGPVNVQRPPAEDPAILARRNFDSLIENATRLSASGQYSDARQAAAQARALGIDNRRVDDLTKSINIQELQAQINDRLAQRQWAQVSPLVDRLSGLDATNALIGTARQRVARGLAEDEGARLERAGISAFFRGDYQNAIATLGKVPSEVTSPRVTFYVACSTAALGILERNDAKRKRARELFLQARPDKSLSAVDRKYISPRILETLVGSS
jgi:tetratricopeptide (TPR) repeat protein